MLKAKHEKNKTHHKIGEIQVKRINRFMFNKHEKEKIVQHLTK